MNNSYTYSKIKSCKSDDFFFDKKFQDEISRNDYKEIINKTLINYLIKNENIYIEK